VASEVLLSFPTEEPWCLPAGWHIDYGWDLPTWPVFAVKMFALLDDVEPEGGGTLLLKGSHRLVERLAEHYGRPVDPWAHDERPLQSVPAVRDFLAGLGTRAQLGAPMEAFGVELCPVEVSGQAGDIVITHMHVFHSPAPNATSRPRQMLGNSFRAKSG
jgi:ectoine hydroxylase-related dioxygenase (phytanoyl-CoA dioxygenase family)